MTSLSQTARATRDRLLRAVLRRAAPPVDGGPIDGGRGDHPLGPADLAPHGQHGPDELPLAPLGQAALAAGQGDAAAIDQALIWIRADEPGQGADWSDAGTVACRLVHLAAIWAWTRPDRDASAAIGGSAQAHARWLVRERPLNDADPAVTLGHAALVIAGLAWPALPDARSWTGEGLASLKSSTQALLGSDGAPVAEPPDVARALWAVALARAWADAAGMPVPAEVTGALIRGSTCLWRLCGDTGDLPAAAPPPPALLPLGPSATSLTLRGLVLAWGLDAGPSVGAHDPAVTRLSGKEPGVDATAMAPDNHWKLWSWRATGMAVAHAQLKGQAGRGWYRQSDGRVQWDLGGEPLVLGHRAPALMVVARVDGPKARVIAVPPDTRANADDRPERDIVWRQARLVVTDRGADRVDWELGEGWTLSPGDQDDWTATVGDRTLVVKLDDDGWSWSVDGRRIVGVGDPTVAVRSIFELR